MDDFGLEEVVDRLGQGPRHGLLDPWRSHGSIVAVTDAAEGRFDACLSQ
jgi:hypothetical protein